MSDVTRRWLYGSPRHRRVVHTDEITNARHGPLKVTMDTYVQAVSDEKRNGQTKVVRILLSGHSQGS